MNRFIPPNSYKRAVSTDGYDEEKMMEYDMSRAKSIPNTQLRDLSATALLQLAKDPPSCQTLEDNNKIVKTPVIKFPLKLMYILDSNKYENIISWTFDGNGFIVNDRRLLTEIVLPSHFKVLKYDSFVRKLYRWGFSKSHRGTRHGYFYNKYFQRGKHELCEKLVSCTKTIFFDHKINNNAEKKPQEILCPRANLSSNNIPLNSDRSISLQTPSLESLNTAFLNETLSRNVNTLSQHHRVTQDTYNVLAIDKARRNYMNSLESFGNLESEIMMRTSELQTIESELAKMNAALNPSSQRNWYPRFFPGGPHIFP